VERKGRASPSRLDHDAIKRNRIVMISSLCLRCLSLLVRSTLTIALTRASATHDSVQPT
jgi:hypothetical protein